MLLRYSNLASSLLIAALFGTANAQMARVYYDELYKAGGLDRMADEYVCFDERPENENFFIFGRSETLKAFFIERKTLGQLSPKERTLLDKGFLSVRGYRKGLPLGDNSDEYVKDGKSWLSDQIRVGPASVGRMRLRISFETLRYQPSVEVMKSGATKEVASAFGRCEVISPTVQQKGN